MDVNKEILSKMDGVTNNVNDTKLKEKMQNYHDKRTGGDKRKGIRKSGGTRWTNRYNQVEQQLENRSDFVWLTICPDYKRYVSEETKTTILDSEYWQKLDVMKKEIENFQITIKTFEGIIS